MESYRDSAGDDLAANRAGLLGPTQRQWLEETLRAYGSYGRKLPAVIAMRRALELGAVRRHEGRFTFERKGGGRGTWWEWSVLDESGGRSTLSPVCAPWPGEGVVYLLPDSVVCVGTEPPSDAQRSASRRLLLELQSLDEAQVAILDSGVMPKGVVRGLRFDVTARGLGITLAVYLVVSVASTFATVHGGLSLIDNAMTYAVGVLFFGGIAVLLALSVRKRKAGAPVRAVVGPPSLVGEGLAWDGKMNVAVDGCTGKIPTAAWQALPRSAAVRAYVDGASGEVVAVVPA